MRNPKHLLHKCVQERQGFLFVFFVHLLIGWLDLWCYIFILSTIHWGIFWYKMWDIGALQRNHMLTAQELNKYQTNKNLTTKVNLRPLALPQDCNKICPFPFGMFGLCTWKCSMWIFSGVVLWRCGGTDFHQHFVLAASWGPESLKYLF